MYISFSFGAFFGLTMLQVTLLKACISFKSVGVEAEIMSDVVVHIPGLIFIKYHKEQSELLVYVSPVSVGPIAVSQNPTFTYYQRPHKAAIQILKRST